MMFLFIVAALLVMMSVVGVYVLGAFAVVILFAVISNYIDGVYDEDKNEQTDNDVENDNNREDF